MSAQSDTTRSESLGVRLTPHEKSELQALAEVRNATLSELVRGKMDELLEEARRAREVFARQSA